jgi:xylulokinase
MPTMPDDAIFVGWDFSTGSAKAVAFDLRGTTVAEARLPTDLWTTGGVSELNLMTLEGQVRQITRMIATDLLAVGRLKDWVAGGISATHHTAGRIDAANAQVRRAICWNDQTLAKYHAEGQERLGGPEPVRELIGGPWAERYSLSHLVKDEATLAAADWARTRWLAQHGSLTAGFLTGNFDTISVSAAASTGLLDLRTCEWQPKMLAALARAENRAHAERCLPRVIDMATPVGRLSESVALDAGLPAGVRPLVFPTLDDQAAGLVGGGAVAAGQLAIILGNSAVVNSSADHAPRSGTLDAMRLNWGPYLWMRCYSNGAQFLDRVVGPTPDWPALERAARAAPPGCGGVAVLPFALSEPSVGVTAPRFEWLPAEPTEAGVKFRASLEALAYLMAMAVAEHEAAGQVVSRVTVSGGIARSDLMAEILASVLNRPLERLASDEGPALGAAVVALAGGEMQGDSVLSPGDAVASAVARLVKFRGETVPRPEWIAAYKTGLAEFRTRVTGRG